MSIERRGLMNASTWGGFNTTIGGSVRSLLLGVSCHVSAVLRRETLHTRTPACEYDVCHAYAPL